jgi:carboxyl-terminal processing protease
MNKATYTKNLRRIGYLLLVCLVFILGAYTGTRKTVAEFISPDKNIPAASSLDGISSAPVAGQDLSQFWYVWNLMQNKYPFADKAPKSGDKIYGAISGMVSSYKDPYTVFFPPQQAKLFNDQVKGAFGGVGMEVGIKNSLLTVIAPIKDSPAYNAGIKSGDIVVQIDRKKTESLDIDSAISLIRGDVGTMVDIGVVRKGLSETKHFQIVRDIVKLPVIDTAVNKDVFVISFYSFSENSAQLFKEALDKFKASGKQKLIIDLRNNPGGYLDAAVDIASYFLPNSATIVRESTGSTNPETSYTSRGYGLLEKNPKLVVLINGGSASASEILAGALSENKVATLIGATSFGKGSVQQVMNLDDGSSVKITVAKWLTPNGVSISEKGIVPEIPVEDKAVLNKKTGKYSDPQLDAAVSLLNK